MASQINFILWGEYFDEQLAITAITSLRAAGLPVKIVGLRGQQVAGWHGVAIATDMTLAQALPLAHQASSVVIPCHTPHVAQISNDPRLHEFLQQAQMNNALFVVGRVTESELALLGLSTDVIIYWLR